jgi:iron(III) transport system substrate-binding protein
MHTASLTRRSFLTATASTLVLAACGGTAAPAASPSSAAAGKPSASPRWGMTADQEAAWEQIEAAAKKEGALTYYVGGNIPQDQVGVFTDAWNKDNPDIKVDVVIAGSGPDMQARVNTEQEAKAYVGDVGDFARGAALLFAGRGEVDAFIPPVARDPNSKYRADPVTDPDKKGYFIANNVTSNPFWINTKLVPAGQEPKTHADLTDPKWKDKILWIAPWATGVGWNVYYYSKKAYGPDWVTKMQAQNATFTLDKVGAVTQVARGEYSILIADGGGANASKLIKDGQPLKAVWPEDFSYGEASGQAILSHGPHPNAAKVFINWMLTESGQEFVDKLSRFPNRLETPISQAWMQGSTQVKQWYNVGDVSEEDAAAVLKEAAGLFKK